MHVLNCLNHVVMPYCYTCLSRSPGSNPAWLSRERSRVDQLRPLSVGGAQKASSSVTRSCSKSTRRIFVQKIPNPPQEISLYLVEFEQKLVTLHPKGRFAFSGTPSRAIGRAKAAGFKNLEPTILYAGKRT